MNKMYITLFFCLGALGVTACGPSSENSAANALDNAGSAVRSLGGPPFYYNEGQPQEPDAKQDDENKKKEQNTN